MCCLPRVAQATVHALQQLAWLIEPLTSRNQWDGRAYRLGCCSALDMHLHGPLSVSSAFSFAFAFALHSSNICTPVAALTACLVGETDA